MTSGKVSRILCEGSILMMQASIGNFFNYYFSISSTNTQLGKCISRSDALLCNRDIILVFKDLQSSWKGHKSQNILYIVTDSILEIYIRYQLNTVDGGVHFSLGNF